MARSRKPLKRILQDEAPGTSATCHFARLPLELRQQIYEYAMEADWFGDVLLIRKKPEMKRSRNKANLFWQDHVISAMFPPLCQASRRMLEEAGPIFLKNVIFILDSAPSFQAFEQILKCEEVTKSIPNAITCVQELWFSAFCPINERSLQENLRDYLEGGHWLYPGFKTDPREQGSALLRQCTGLRKVVVHTGDWRFVPPSSPRLYGTPQVRHPPVCSSDRLLKRALHVNDIIQLPKLEKVTIFCTKTVPTAHVNPVDLLSALSRATDFLVEGTREHRRADKEEEAWYHLYDLQRIYEPDRDSSSEFEIEDSGGKVGRKDLVADTNYRWLYPYRHWYEAQAGRHFPGAEQVLDTGTTVLMRMKRKTESIAEARAYHVIRHTP
ncbi:hypothetical protein BDV96DRAFT_606248 [Lophiotrema nucula]|uniref:F-box domain-containing protein n=1 Tax=Lophiotrema nucula TaxID=690887 RepID=A0A6A5YL59_9PLEO|nr:hypothetical protein BDV96DRAFT_606248 [Lophiotrema nucula]